MTPRARKTWYSRTRPPAGGSFHFKSMLLFVGVKLKLFGAGPWDRACGSSISLFQAGSFQAGSFQVGSFQAGSFQAGSFQVGSFQAGSFQAGSFADSSSSDTSSVRT